MLLLQEEGNTTKEVVFPLSKSKMEYIEIISYLKFDIVRYGFSPVKISLEQVQCTFTPLISF